ncbi:MAG TPA: peptidylprolyl isomerase [Cytophagaceae bacterium]|jgi:peptidyl-prolyl cis-trans isomerase D
MKYITAISLIITFAILNVQSGYSQKMFKVQGNEAWDYLVSKKEDFKAAINDSLFVTKNGDKPYRYVYLRRGDQEQDVEEVIYKSNPGDVVGPFPGEDYNYLFKIRSLDSIKQRISAKHIFILKGGKAKRDSLSANKIAIKVKDALEKGELFDEVFKANSDNFASFAALYGVTGNYAKGGLGWIWEDQTLPEFFQPLNNANTGDIIIINTRYAVHVVIVGEKEKGPSKATLVPLVKITPK